MKPGTVKRVGEDDLIVICPHVRGDACPACYKKAVANAYNLGEKEARDKIAKAVAAWQKLGLDLLRHPEKYIKKVAKP